MSQNTTTYRSHFSQLLSAFRVSGTELADAIHIDSSLVSKWKNNKRSLKSNSPLLNSIIDYFLSLDSLSGYSTLRTLLGPEFLSLETASPEQIRTALKRWLLSSVEAPAESLSLRDFSHSCKKGKEFSHLQFHGNEGKREAILGLLRMAISLPAGQELWCMMQDTQSWFTEDSSYVNIWESVNLAFLASGNRIRVIHTLERQYNMLAKSLLYWLPLYLTGRVSPYFMSPNTHLASICKSVLLLKDKMLLYQLAPSDDSFEGTTVAISNELVLQEAYQLLQVPFSYAAPLFSFYYQQDYDKYARFLSQMVNLDEDQYVFMRFPFVNVLPTQQIKEILEENHVDPATVERALLTSYALKNDARRNSGHHFRYLIPRNMLEKLLSQEQIMLDSLSFFSGKPLYISNATFRGLLRRLASLLVRESHTSIHEITLLEDIHAKQLRGLNMFVKKNTCISIFNSPEHFWTDEEPLLLTSTESPIIHSLYMFCDHLWESVMPQKKERAYVSRQLEILLETTPPPQKKVTATSQKKTDTSDIVLAFCLLLFFKDGCVSSQQPYLSSFRIYATRSPVLQPSFCEIGLLASKRYTKVRTIPAAFRPMAIKKAL